MRLRNTFIDTIYEVGRKDDSIIVLVADISHFRFQKFAQECPGRYYNVGICENTVLSMASGLSILGFNPVVHTISPFLIERSFEQIKLDFGYQELGVNIIAVGSAFDYADLGATHHCYGDFALIKTIPGSHIIYPASHIEFEVIFQQVYNTGKLNVWRIPYHNHDIPLDPKTIEFGKGIIIKEGSDLTIIVAGTQLKTVMASLPELEKLGIHPEILYIHTIKPFDETTVKTSLEKTKKCLVIEEHCMYGGIFEDVLRCANGLDYKIKISSINIGDKFIHEYGTYEQLCQRLGFTPENIIEKITQELMG
jgi:transketolase